MSKTIALHGSKDLLIQARQDLVNAGFKDDTEWNDMVIDWSTIEYLCLAEYLLVFHSHDCDVPAIPLTPENYAETIQSIILKNDELCQTN